jgi:hypothetical protein
MAVVELPRDLENIMQKLEQLDNSRDSIDRISRISEMLKTNDNTKPDNRNFVHTFIFYLKQIINIFYELNKTTLESRSSEKILYTLLYSRRILFKLINTIIDGPQLLGTYTTLENIINTNGIGLSKLNVDNVRQLKGLYIKLNEAKKDITLFEKSEQKISREEALTPVETINLGEAKKRLRIYLYKFRLPIVLNTANAQARIDSIERDITAKRNEINALLSDDVIIEKIKSNTNFLDSLLQYYIKYVLPSYKQYYLSTIPLNLILPNGEERDYRPDIYKLHYSLKMLISEVSKKTLGANGNTVSVNTDLVGQIAQYDPATGTETITHPADNPSKILKVNAYNSLTDFYDKYIKPYGTGDLVDVAFTRSHFYPAIEAMYKSLPAVKLFKKIPLASWIGSNPLIKKWGNPGVSRPIRGGLRYGRRKKNEGL